MEKRELMMIQSLPLEIKVAKTKQRMREALQHFGKGGLYVSFSGGKDSTVLHHILLEVEKEIYGEKVIPRVFCDTGLEFPEVKEHAHKIADVILRPAIPFTQVIHKWGYPVVSKEQSRYLWDYRFSTEHMRQLRINGNKNGVGKISKKWFYLTEADFNISHKCCDEMKKKPFKKYGKETGRIPMVGIMAEESRLRTYIYLQSGCNAFNNTHPSSMPLGFWREQDILQYLYENKIEIPSVYGDIIIEDNQYTTTGRKRTGCIFCMYGLSKKVNADNFVKLKESHPQLHDYCIRGGKYNDEGCWVPDKGLGLGHVLDTLNVKY